MNEQDFGRSLARRLDAGAEDLAPSIVHRLLRAREAALAQASETEAALSPASGRPEHALLARTGSNHVGWFRDRRTLAPLVGFLLLAAVVLSWEYQTRKVPPGENGGFVDIDAEVLIDELPVVAYLDPGFEIWLYHQTPAEGGQ